jgi:hypothetical protein
MEKRKHLLDTGMVQELKTISGHDNVEKDHWFTTASNSTVTNRQADGPGKSNPALV